jgi:SpoVK/Ycf46/Vps4 family AAA+-type ATPase
MHIEFDDPPAAPPPPPPADTKQTPVIVPRLTQSQSAVSSSLVRLWESRQKPEVIAGIRLRRHPLLIGASGTGKSMLARELAKTINASFFGTSPGSWIIHGAKHQPYTMAAIASRFQRTTAMVVFIDELEKLGTRRANTSDWTRCVYDEIFCLLDGRLDGIDGWNALLEGRTKTDMLVVCAATFQDLYREKVGAPGQALFDQQWEEASIRGALQTQDLLPEELIYRFGAVLELSHPTADEWRERVAAIHAELGISGDSEAVARALLRSGKGMRALEEYLTGLMLRGPAAPDRGEAPA